MPIKSDYLKNALTTKKITTTEKNKEIKKLLNYIINMHSHTLQHARLENYYCTVGRSCIHPKT